eukprot:g14698.t1
MGGPGSGRRRPIPVICVENGETYPSVIAAARALGVHSEKVRRAVMKGTTVDGHTFLKKQGDSCPVLVVHIFRLAFQILRTLDAVEVSERELNA